MTDTQKIILIALVVLGGLCLLVGLVLTHHIGGFLSTVEREAQEEAEAEAAMRAAADEKASADGDQK